ncbi:MAG: protein kinase [Myxococcales bacterium]|nr:protein kinase [Myxococcales bacterium]
MMSDDPLGWAGHCIAGRYRVDALVDEGGFACVYRGHHLELDQPVALKCLRVPATLRPADREQFLHAFREEGRLLHRLSRAHAGIVQALDLGAAVSPLGVWTPYLVLEWLEGEALERLLSRRAAAQSPFTLAEAMAVLEPAVEALDVAHRLGVAHRDVKPANLYATEIAGKRVLKVLDCPALAELFEDARRAWSRGR